MRKGSGCQRKELGKQLAETRNGNAGSCSWARFPLNVAEKSREQHIRQRQVRESPCRVQGRSRCAFQLTPFSSLSADELTDGKLSQAPFLLPSECSSGASPGGNPGLFSLLLALSLKPFQTLLGPMFLPSSNSPASSPPSIVLT